MIELKKCIDQSENANKLLLLFFFLYFIYLLSIHIVCFKAGLQKIMIIIISLSFTVLELGDNIFDIFWWYKQLFEICYIYIYCMYILYYPTQVYCMRIKLDILIYATLYKELGNNIVTLCDKLLKFIVLCFMWVYCMNTNKVRYNMCYGVML